MAFTRSVPGIESTITAGGFQQIDPADWSVLDTEVLKYEQAGYPTLLGSRTTYVNVNTPSLPINVRIEIIPSRDKDGVPKFNTSIRWSGSERVDDTVAGTFVGEPYTAVLAWTTSRDPRLVTDEDDCMTLLMNLVSFVIAGSVTGNAKMTEIHDNVSVGITNADYSTVVRT